MPRTWRSKHCKSVLVITAENTCAHRTRPIHIHRRHDAELAAIPAKKTPEPGQSEHGVRGSSRGWAAASSGSLRKHHTQAERRTGKSARLAEKTARSTVRVVRARSSTNGPAVPGRNPIASSHPLRTEATQTAGTRTRPMLMPTDDLPPIRLCLRVPHCLANTSYQKTGDQGNQGKQAETPVEMILIRVEIRVEMTYEVKVRVRMQRREVGFRLATNRQPLFFLRVEGASFHSAVSTCLGKVRSR